MSEVKDSPVSYNESGKLTKRLEQREMGYRRRTQSANEHRILNRIKTDQSSACEAELPWGI